MIENPEKKRCSDKVYDGILFIVDIISSSGYAKAKNHIIYQEKKEKKPKHHYQPQKTHIVHSTIRQNQQYLVFILNL